MENLETHDIPAQELLCLYPQSVLLDDDAEEVLFGSIAHVVFDNGVIGYIIVEEDNDKQEILFLEVSEKFRGKGLGSALIKKYVEPSRPSWVYPLDPIARAFFNKVKADMLPLLEIEE